MSGRRSGVQQASYDNDLRSASKGNQGGGSAKQRKWDEQSQLTESKRKDAKAKKEGRVWPREWSILIDKHIEAKGLQDIPTLEKALKVVCPHEIKLNKGEARSECRR